MPLRFRRSDRHHFGPSGPERRDSISGTGGIPAAVPQAAGQIGTLPRGPEPAIGGWILDPDLGPYDEVRVLVDGRDAGAAEPRPAPGIAASLPWIRGAARAGFGFRLGAALEGTERIDLLGLRGGAAAGRYGTLLRLPADEALPVPPPEIALPSNAFARGRRGGAGGDWTRGYLASGLAAAANLLERIGEDGLSLGETRLLDWGCGSGKVLRHLLGRGLASVTGCDLDAGAISWCREQIGGADFVASSPAPPLPFEDGSFEAVVGCSVMTHLDAPTQALWLAELRRVVVPGGLVLLSTQGDFAYRRGALRGSRLLQRSPRLAAALAGRLGRRLERRGFVDRGATRALKGLAPSGYYRSVAQSPAYTREAWSPHFEIAELIERGLDGNQDLVVMRRPR